MDGVLKIASSTWHRLPREIRDEVYLWVFELARKERDIEGNPFYIRSRSFQNGFGIPSCLNISRNIEAEAEQLFYHHFLFQTSWEDGGPKFSPNQS